LKERTLLAAFALLAGALALLGPNLGTLGPALVLHTLLIGILLRLAGSLGAAPAPARAPERALARVPAPDPAPEPGPPSGPRLLDQTAVLLGGALLLRLLFLVTTPDLSVDPYRYVWDGWLHSDGINPYRHTPSDPSLVGRHGSLLFGAMNSRDFYSIYPPLSQWLFYPAGALYERLGWPGSWFVLKGTVAAAEFGGVLLLHRALRRMHTAPRLLALYAWNPLVLVTVAGVGHSEGGLVLAIGILALGLAAARPALAWAGLGLAVISKGIPLVLAPLLFRHHRGRFGTRRTLAALALGALPALVLSAPLLFPGLVSRAGASADLYVTLFEFNAGLHALLTTLLQPFTAAHAGALVGPGLRLAFAALAVAICLRHPVGRPAQVLAAGLLLMGLYLATATTVHPWYLIWGLVLIPFTPRHRSAWLWASWAGFATYLAYTGVPGALLALVFWGGVAALVLLEEGWRVRDFLLPWAGRRKARQIAPHLAGGTVLDLGAGEGFVGRALSDSGYRVVLADVDPYPRVGLPAVQTEGARLPFARNGFDTVVLSLVLHHAEAPDLLLAEALRVARLRVVVTESTYRWEWERRLLEWADRRVNRRRGAGAMADAEGPLDFDTPQGWEDRARRAGARVLDSRRLNRIGHRHHLLVLEPESGSALVTPARRP
jgi:alpha-1,6-mannosyltransferase